MQTCYIILQAGVKTMLPSISQYAFKYNHIYMPGITYENLIILRLKPIPYKPKFIARECTTFVQLLNRKLFSDNIIAHKCRSIHFANCWRS